MVGRRYTGSRLETLLSWHDRYAPDEWEKHRRLIGRTPYCNEAILEKVRNGNGEKLWIQRQELRLAKQLTHDATEKHLYSLGFRMPKTIGDQTNSIQWATAQWKQEPVSDAYKKECGMKWEQAHS